MRVTSAKSADYDVAVVGASLAGCTSAILLARAGASVALIEKQPDPLAFKRICSHLIQASAIPVLERLGLLDPVLAAGGVRSRLRMWTRWGWIDPGEGARYAVNLRREVLDPMLREMAAGTPGVDLLLGNAAQGLLRDEDRTVGIALRDPTGGEAELSARLVVGADGRDSRVAELARVPEKRRPHGRFVYGGYFEGPPPRGAPDASAWFMDPQWALAAPTDDNLTLYAAMPTKDRLPEFKEDPAEALVSFIADIPAAPPIASSRLVSPLLGKLDMTNRVRRPTASGLALVGDAALATDPLFGVGCGWAFQSAEWLADSVGPALSGDETLDRGLNRYRRRHANQLRGHAFFIHDYSTGRRLKAPERAIWAAAARDPQVATAVETLATRSGKPVRTIARAMPRAISVNVKHALGGGREADART